MKRKYIALKIAVGSLITAIMAIGLLFNPAALRSVSAQGGSGEGSRKPPVVPGKGTATPRRPTRSNPRGETRPRQGSATNSAELSALARADRARDYLVNTRGIDAGRIQIIDGGYRTDATFDLFICPTGATPPAPKVGASLLNLDRPSSSILSHYGRFLLQDVVTGAFEGRVVDDTDAPVASASVQFIHQDTGVPITKRTDSDGRFFQGILQPGTYTIRISAPGFEPLEVVRRLIAAQVTRIIPTPLVLERATSGRIRRCPAKVIVSCPDLVDAGSPLTFLADITGGVLNTPRSYNWTISAGTITSGQGTANITVNTTGVGGSSITATMELGGYPSSCSNLSPSCTTQVSAPQTCRMWDEYGNISFEDEKARLDNFAIQVQKEPGTRAYIYASNGRKK